jgi:uncharacterized membrane protein
VRAVTNIYSNANERRGTVIAGGLALGLGLGGFVDGILLRQILQWHHLLTGREAADSLAALERHIVWDGIFHVAALVTVVIGVSLLARAISFGDWWPRGALWGLVMAGWGAFVVVEGIVAHHLLGIHHVRDDVSDPLRWDVGILVAGGALLLGGWAMARRSLRHP